MRTTLIVLIIFFLIGCQEAGKNVNDVNTKHSPANIKVNTIDNTRHNTRGFFANMDTISEYKCVCNKEKKDSTRLYVYLSLDSTKIGQKAYFNFKFFLDGFDTSFPDMVTWQGDTLIYRMNGYYQQIAYSYKEAGKAVPKMDTASESPFLIFNNASDIEWYSKNPTGFSGLIEKNNNSIDISGNLFYVFNLKERLPTLSHSPYINKIYANKSHGIVYIDYFDGNKKYDCLIKAKNDL
jgi:hypothetical protein